MKRLFLILLAVCFLFTGFLTGCSKYIQLNPSTDESAYEGLGRDVGSYLKTTKDKEWLAKSKKWADDALLLTDTELLEGNVLQVAYEQLLAKYLMQDFLSYLF